MRRRNRCRSAGTSSVPPPSLGAEMKVAGIEQGDGLKSIEIVDDQGPVAQGDQSRGAQFLQGSVHVHGGQSDSLAQVHLCDRELAGVIVGKAHGAQAEEEFAQEVRDPLQGCPKPEVDRPFPLDRRENEGFPPEGLPDARGPGGHLVERFTRELGNRQRRQCRNGMIHLAQDEIVRGLPCLQGRSTR